jgi:excisionase family DNA binding protein
MKEKRVGVTLPPMTTRTVPIKQSLDSLRQALEEFESRLLEFEEALEGDELEGRETVRPRNREGPQLLSIPDVCQELGMGKSWVYRRLKGGEIPSIKLGSTIKVKRADLDAYVENRRYSPPENVPSSGEG